jgi:hypothetical protein
MPSFNSPFIFQAVSSVLSQTLGEWELLILDMAQIIQRACIDWTVLLSLAKSLDALQILLSGLYLCRDYAATDFCQASVTMEKTEASCWFDCS